MLVKLFVFILPFLHLISGATNVTVAYGDTHIITTGAWSKSTGCGYYTPTLRGSASLTFSGVAVYVLGNRNGYGGVVQFSVDGQSARSVDLYGAVSCGEVLFSSTGLSNGQHTIKVELTGMSPNVRPTAGYPDGLFVLTNFMYSIPDPTDSTTSTPTGTLPSGSVPTQTAVASGSTPDLSKVQKLWTCKPYGPSDCTFDPQTPAGLNTYALIVGSAGSNCGGGTENLITTLGGQLVITDTWSQSLSVGLSLGSEEDGLNLKISAERSWGKTTSRQVSQTFQITIPPQRKGALLAQVTYNSTNGTLEIGKDSPFPVVAHQPRGDVIYVANIVPCNAEFDANSTTGPSQKAISTSQTTKLYSHAMVVVMTLAVYTLLLNLM